jgi:hypothetical protein
VFKSVADDIRHVWDVTAGFMDVAGGHTSVIQGAMSNAEDFTKLTGSVQGLLRCTGALFDAVQRVAQPSKTPLLCPHYQGHTDQPFR